jgi:23S rRNA A1618 N6-methylase RlmF
MDEDTATTSDNKRKRVVQSSSQLSMVQPLPKKQKEKQKAIVTSVVNVHHNYRLVLCNHSSLFQATTVFV